MTNSDMETSYSTRPKVFNGMQNSIASSWTAGYGCAQPVPLTYSAVLNILKHLNDKQKRHLRQLAHKLKPLVIIGGNGLTESVVNEINQTLAHHELIKVRVNAVDREERDAMIAAICEELDCVLVQRIGHIAVIYREAEKPVIRLP